VAVDCFTQGTCGTSVIRAGRVFTGHAVGVGAWFYGALLVTLALVMANLVVTEAPGLSRLTQYRDARGKERTRYGVAWLCLLAAFLILDTALVRGLAYALGPR
jgi:hypothetical protein